MKTREQEWAQSAYDKVHNRQQKDRSWQDKYISQARGFSQLVKTSGLAQAIAFVASRGEEAQRAFLHDVAGTLGYESVEDLEKRAREAPLSEYIRLTRQVLGVAQWYRRYADIILAQSAGDGERVERGVGG